MSKDSEAPAKNWQVSALEKRQDLQDTLNQRIDDKLDRLLVVVQTLPTNEQLEGKISLVKSELQSQLANSIERQDLKYQPIINTNKWFLRLLITTTVGLVGSVVLLLISVLLK